MQEVRFDDIDALRARAGEGFSPFGAEIEISQSMINRFAEVTGDHQWIHVDLERARREGPFGATVAHGFLVLGLLPRLRVRPDLRITGYTNVINYGADRLRFTGPVRAGSTVRARMRLVAVEPRDKGTLVKEEIEVVVAGPETVALSYLMVVLYRGPRPAAP